MDSASADGREPQLEADVHGVADPLGGCPFALAETEVEALEVRRALHDRRLSSRRKRERDGHGPLLAPYRQLAVGAPAVARTLESLGVIHRLRVLCCREEVRTAQDLVALAVLRVDGRRIHGHVEPARCGLAGIEVEHDPELLEGTGEPGVRLDRRKLERAGSRIRLPWSRERSRAERDGERDG